MSQQSFYPRTSRRPDLETLLKQTRSPTEDELHEQRISFAAGNLALDRPEDSLDEIKARVRSAAEQPLRSVMGECGDHE